MENIFMSTSDICTISDNVIVNTYSLVSFSLLERLWSDDLFLSRERDCLSRDLWRRLRDRERLLDDELVEGRRRDLTTDISIHLLRSYKVTASIYA